jgi:hypothetical protein
VFLCKGFVESVSHLQSSVQAQAAARALSLALGSAARGVPCAPSGPAERLSQHLSAFGVSLSSRPKKSQICRFLSQLSADPKSTGTHQNSAPAPHTQAGKTEDGDATDAGDTESEEVVSRSRPEKLEAKHRPPTLLMGCNSESGSAGAHQSSNAVCEAGSMSDAGVLRVQRSRLGEAAPFLTSAGLELCSGGGSTGIYSAGRSSDGCTKIESAWQYGNKGRGCEGAKELSGSFEEQEAEDQSACSDNGLASTHGRQALPEASVDAAAQATSDDLDLQQALQNALQGGLQCVALKKAALSVATHAVCCSLNPSHCFSNILYTESEWIHRDALTAACLFVHGVNTVKRTMESFSGRKGRMSNTLLRLLVFTEIYQKDVTRK